MDACLYTHHKSQQFKLLDLTAVAETCHELVERTALRVMLER